MLLFFQGKEVAVNITPLPSGTVIFEDISVERRTGKIQKTLRSNKRASDPLGGRIQYDTAKGWVPINCKLCSNFEFKTSLLSIYVIKWNLKRLLDNISFNHCIKLLEYPIIFQSIRIDRYPINIVDVVKKI